MRTTISGKKSTDTVPGCGSAAPSNPRADRAGGAGVFLLLALLVAAGATAWVLLSSPAGRPEADTRAVREVEVEAPADDLVAPASSEDDLRAPRPVGRVEAGEPGLYAQMERTFDGTGTILGEIVTDPSTPYPDQWTVTLEPSRVAQGSERAIHQEVNGEPGQRTFELRDLPMAAYRISATAPGMRSMAQEVALFRIQGGALDRVSVTLKLRPVAYVDGAIRTAEGEVADALPVFLVPRGGPDGGTLTTTTDSAGIFRFDGVESGAWALHIGREARPLVAPIPVTVEATPVRVDDVTLQQLATLRLAVIDEFGRPCPDVALVGYLRGAGMGSFRATTDAIGHAEIRYLAAGPWRVEAEDPNDGQTGRRDLALVLDDTGTRHEIQIR
ncbi:MAG: hypothetical protein AAGB93_07580 [Planctomycetota bacterium]